MTLGSKKVWILNLDITLLAHAYSKPHLMLLSNNSSLWKKVETTPFVVRQHGSHVASRFRRCSKLTHSIYHCNCKLMLYLDLPSDISSDAVAHNSHWRSLKSLKISKVAAEDD